MSEPIGPFIVAEISKNWIDGREVRPGSGLLAQQFERVINVNADRGYRLMMFQVHRQMVSADEMNETIIAVFERAPVPAPSITCPRCGAVSYNPQDIAQRYCGRCHVFLDD